MEGEIVSGALNGSLIFWTPKTMITITETAKNDNVLSFQVMFYYAIQAPPPQEFIFAVVRSILLKFLQEVYLGLRTSQ
jgi:hypothetical protein